MSRNDAPLSLGSVGAQPPQKTPSERDNPADDAKTPTSSPRPQAATRQTVKDTWDHSRGSNESWTLPLRDRQKSPLQSPGTGGKSRGCKVSSATNDQVGPAIKTVQETEKQVRTKVDAIKVGERKAGSKATDEKVEMETKRIDRQPTKKKSMKFTTDKEKEKLAESSEKQMSEPTLKSGEKTRSSRSSNTPEAPDKTSQRATPPNVISIAELLRSQIKALDSMLEGSAGFIREPPATETHRDLKGDAAKRLQEVQTSNRKIEDIPLRNIKETLLEVYQQLQLDQEQSELQDAAPAPEKLPGVPAVDAGTSAEADKKQKLLCQVTDARPPVKPETRAPGSNLPVVKDVTDEADQDKHEGFLPKPSPVLKYGSKIKTQSPDQSQKDKFQMENIVFLNVQKVPAEQELVTHSQVTDFSQQDSLMVEDVPPTDSSSSPLSSPLLTRRSRSSATPAATEQELASGARRKITKEKSSADEAPEAPSPPDHQDHIHNPSAQSPKFSSSPAPLPSSPSLQKRSHLLQPPAHEKTSLERRSPGVNRKKTQPENPTQSQKPSEETHLRKTEEEPAKNKKPDPFRGRKASVDITTL